MAPRLLNTGEAAGLAELVMGNLNELTFDTSFFSREANREEELKGTCVTNRAEKEGGEGKW